MIEIRNVTKHYGKHTIIDQLDLTIENGQVYGLLGKNGAGKTTLLHMILDLVEPDQGRIQLFGQAHTTLDKASKRRIGVVDESLALIEEMSGFDFLLFVGKIYKMPSEMLKKRIADLFGYFFENEADLKKSMAKYSTGMKKKIAFCAAILHTPDVLILDEPFSGLDPLVANQMVVFLKKYHRPDRLMLISSHDLSYVEKIATHIGVLDNKKLVFNSSIQDFTENGMNKLDAALLNILKPNESQLEKMDWIV